MLNLFSPWFQDGDKYRHHQYQELKSSKPEIHLLVVQVGCVTESRHAEFAGDLHHGRFPGAKKKGAKYNSEQARKDAIHAILFSGISGGNGCTTQPPILNKTEELENFKTIEKSFFSKKGTWSMFTRSSTSESTLPANLGIKNWKVYQVSISKNELRKYLEEQKIIKSLTNGF